MTVADLTVTRVQQSGDGVTSSVAIPFQFIDENDLLVIHTDALGVDTEWTYQQAPGSWSFTGGDFATGTVNFTAADCATGERLTVVLTSDYGQPQTLAGGEIDPVVIEKSMDRTTLQVQALAGEVDRSLSVSPSQAGDLIDLQVPDLQDGEGFVRQGDKLVPVAIDSALISSLTASAVTAASEASASAAAAAASASLAGAPFVSRATAQAANVDGSLNEIKVIHAGEILTYQRDASGTALTTNDGANWSPAGLKTVKHYGAVGDGSTDDSTAIQAALDDADNEALVFNQGGNYVVNSGLTVVDKNITILAFGATLTQGADVQALYMHATVADVTTASSLNNADTVDVSQGGGVSSPVASVTFAAPPPFAVGDVVKVVSDDQWTGSGVAGQFWGEPGRVIAISGNTLYLSKRFLSDVPASPTNIRVGKLRPFRMEIHGLTLDTAAAGDAANWTAQLLKLRGLVGARLRDLKVVKAWAIGIEAQSCVELNADGIEGANLSNDPSNSRYGYLINDKSGYGNRWAGLVGGNCRHVYTTNQDGGLSAGSDLRLYGQTIGCHVPGGMSTDCLGSGFDTHHDAVGVTFSDCVSIGAVRGEDAVGSGFQVRGRGVVLRDCKSIGTKWGVQILQQYATGATQGTVIDGLTSDTPSAAVLISGQSGNDIDGIVLKNLNSKVSAHDHAIEGSYCDAKVRNSELALTGAVANARVIQADADASFVVTDTLLDLKGHTGATPYLFGVGTATSDIRTRRVECEGAWEGIFDMNSADGTGFVKGAIQADAQPGLAAAYLNRGASAKVGVNWEVGLHDTAFEDYRAFIFDVSWTTAGAKSIDLDFCSAEHIYVRITNTHASAYLWEVLNGGLFLGQKLTIMNRDNSSQQFEIRANSPGGLALGPAGEFLTIARGMTLMWEPGSPGKWRPITE
ncbi:glycosyl hydrolase family 28-related protein [Roseibium album]|uniref:glycosyl hydrolase family 28-related protein n=1 Tax=Roseibium album TaxID=311410 RepID=UPI00391920C6